MELPAYRLPKLTAVLRRMLEAGWAFVRRAGTIILAAMILIWALLYFPHTDANGVPYYQRIEVSEETAAAGEERLVALQEQAMLSAEQERELAWDWKIGMAALASFPAREVIVGTLGMIYDVGEVDPGAIGDEEADDEAKAQAAGLQSAVKADWAKDPIRGKYGVAVAISIMVFFALCCQCASTLAIIRRETRSWAWPAFTFVYMTALAYLAALIAFQIGVVVTDMV
jgi:ferrous iron transport protein B